MQGPVLRPPHRPQSSRKIMIKLAPQHASARVSRGCAESVLDGWNVEDPFGTPADAKRLLGDLVLLISEVVANGTDATMKLGRHRRGTPVKLTIRRRGRSVIFKVRNASSSLHSHSSATTVEDPDADLEGLEGLGFVEVDGVEVKIESLPVRGRGLEIAHALCTSFSIRRWWLWTFVKGTVRMPTDQR